MGFEKFESCLHEQSHVKDVIVFVVERIAKLVDEGNS